MTNITHIAINHREADNAFVVSTGTNLGRVRYAVSDTTIQDFLIKVSRYAYSDHPLAMAPFYTFNGALIGWLQLCHRIQCIRQGIPDTITPDKELS